MKGFFKIKKYALLLSILLLFVTQINAQQVVNANIINNNGTTELDLINTTDINTEMNFDGEVLQNQVDLYRLEAGVDGAAQWVLDHFTNSEQTYFKLNSLGGVSFSLEVNGGQITAFRNTNNIGSSSFVNGDILRIERNNGHIIAYKNSDVIFDDPNAPADVMFASVVVNATGTQSGVRPNILFTFPESVSTPGNTVDICLRIDNGSDDADQSGQYTTLDRSQLKIGEMIVGLRFNNLNIPAGSTISNAHIQFTASQTNTQTINLTITGHLIGNAPEFLAQDNNISDRVKTSASISWPVPSWSNGASTNDQRTPDISSIITELINHPDFVVGNSIVIIIEGGTGRNAVAYEDQPNNAAELCISYQSSSTPPTVDTRTYTKLKKELDGSYVQLECANINFQYIEDYAIVPGENSVIECKIYDWQRVEKFNTSLANSYGVNWQNIVPDNNLFNSNTFYTLEVTGANKGEKYKLRVKTGDTSVPCPTPGNGGGSGQ